MLRVASEHDDAMPPAHDLQWAIPDARLMTLPTAQQAAAACPEAFAAAWTRFAA